jgi:ubiquinone/menaquinone biosynthesis C-methylase UbiE
MATEHEYLPAMGHDWLLPLYGPMTRLLGVPAMHRRLVEQAQLRPGHVVLEIGTGPGDVAMLAKRTCPGATVTGLDPDPRVLARARRKADRASLAIQWDRGFAGELPYADDSVDRVLSSLMFHHLDEAEKERAAREILRVLKPGGRLHLLDFAGGPQRPHGLFPRWAHRNERMHSHTGDGIPKRLREAGLSEIAEVEHRSMLGARVTYFRAEKLAAAARPATP